MEIEPVIYVEKLDTSPKTVPKRQRNAIRVAKRAIFGEIVQTMPTAEGAIPVERKGTLPEIAQILKVKELTLKPSATSVVRGAILHATVLVLVLENAINVASLAIMQGIANQMQALSATSVITQVTLPVIVNLTARLATVVEKQAT